MAQSWRYARVAVVPTAGATIAASVQAWAVAGSSIEQAGLDQADAVQLAADLAMLRHTATNGDVGHFAVYDASGAFTREVWARSEELDVAPDETVLAIVGDEPIRAFMVEGNGELGSDWPRQLALAIDRCLVQVRDSAQAGAIPSGFGSVGLPVLAPAVIAIIVGGAALGIIGSVAVWRYLDPVLRLRLAAVRSAAAAYQARIAVWKETGRMPEPSAIELANADAVRNAGSEASASSWLVGGAAIGGIVLGGLAVGAIRRAVAGAA